MMWIPIVHHMHLLKDNLNTTSTGSKLLVSDCAVFAVDLHALLCPSEGIYVNLQKGRLTPICLLGLLFAVEDYHALLRPLSVWGHLCGPTQKANLS